MPGLSRIAAGRFNDGGAGLKFPSLSATAIMLRQIRSFTDRQLKDSILAHTSASFFPGRVLSHDGRGADEIQNGSGAIMLATVMLGFR
jgi:hypothetical protein